jgi:transcriptional regulator with XRE-family HTH domain
MTQSQLGQLAGIPASTIGSLEGGFYRLNVDLLHRIVAALGVDIGTVWPRSERSGEEPTGLFRLRELHLLTAAEASCVLVSDCSTNASGGRVLYSIGSGEIPELQSDQQQHGAWIIFLRHGRAKTIALCLKNAAIDDWMELLIERYLPLWLLNVEI